MKRQIVIGYPWDILIYVFERLLDFWYKICKFYLVLFHPDVVPFSVECYLETKICMFGGFVGIEVTLFLGLVCG